MAGRLLRAYGEVGRRTVDDGQREVLRAELARTLEAIDAHAADDTDVRAARRIADEVRATLG